MFSYSLPVTLEPGRCLFRRKVHQMILRRRRLPSKAVLLAVVVASGGQSCRNGEGRVSLPRGVNRDAFVATSSAAPLRRSASSAYQRHGRSPAEPLCLRIKKAGVDGRQQRPCIVAELPVSAAGAAGAETNEQDPPAEHVNGSHTGGQEEADEDLWSSVEWAGERDGMSGGGSEAMVGSQEFVSLVKAQFDLLSTVLGAHRVLLFVRRESSETGGTTDGVTSYRFIPVVFPVVFPVVVAVVAAAFVVMHFHPWQASQADTF